MTTAVTTRRVTRREAVAVVMLLILLMGTVAFVLLSQTVRGAREPSASVGVIRVFAGGQWFRNSSARGKPIPAETPPVPEVPRAGDLSAAQGRLAAHVVESHRVDAGHASTIVALAYGVATELRIDPLLILAVISVESSFDRFAQSRRGAQGLMQIHTQAHADRLEPFGGAEAAFDPHVNIRVGAELLREHLLREGSTQAALKAYVGAARLSNDGGYGARVLRARDQLREVADGRYELVLRAAPDSQGRGGS